MAKDTFRELPVPLFKTMNIEVFCSNSFLIVTVVFVVFFNVLCLEN